MNRSSWKFRPITGTSDVLGSFVLLYYMGLVSLLRKADMTCHDWETKELLNHG